MQRTQHDKGVKKRQPVMTQAIVMWHTFFTVLTAEGPLNPITPLIANYLEVTSQTLQTPKVILLFWTTVLPKLIDPVIQHPNLTSGIQQQLTRASAIVIEYAEIQPWLLPLMYTAIGHQCEFWCQWWKQTENQKCNSAYMNHELVMLKYRMDEVQWLLDKSPTYMPWIVSTLYREQHKKYPYLATTTTATSIQTTPTATTSVQPRTREYKCCQLHVLTDAFSRQCSAVFLKPRRWSLNAKRFCQALYKRQVIESRVRRLQQQRQFKLVGAKFIHKLLNPRGARRITVFDFYRFDQMFGAPFFRIATVRDIYQPRHYLDNISTIHNHPQILFLGNTTFTESTTIINRIMTANAQTPKHIIHLNNSMYRVALRFSQSWPGFWVIIISRNQETASGATKCDRSIQQFGPIHASNIYPSLVKLGLICP